MTITKGQELVYGVWITAAPARMELADKIDGALREERDETAKACIEIAKNYMDTGELRDEIAEKFGVDA